MITNKFIVTVSGEETAEETIHCFLEPFYESLLVEEIDSEIILPGDVVEHVHNRALDPHTVIGVGEKWLFLDFQLSELERGELPTPLPKKNYRKVADQ